MSRPQCAPVGLSVPVLRVRNWPLAVGPVETTGMARTAPAPTHTNTPTLDHDRLQLLTEQQVSDLLAVPLQTLRNHRSQRRGIPFVRLGRAVRYKRSVVEQYINAGAVAVSNGEGTRA